MSVSALRDLRDRFEKTYNTVAGLHDLSSPSFKLAAYSDSEWGNYADPKVDAVWTMFLYGVNKAKWK